MGAAFLYQAAETPNQRVERDANISCGLIGQGFGRAPHPGRWPANQLNKRVKFTVTDYLRKVVQEYWYIDEKGILSLVAQCNEYLEEERSYVKSKSNEKKTGLHLAIKAIAAIFGSVNVKTDISQNISRGFQETTKIIKRAEQHLSDLIDKLNQNGQLSFFKNINELLLAKEAELPLFCIASIDFLLDKEYYLEKDESYSLLLPNNNLSNNVSDLIKKEKFVLFKANIEEHSFPALNWQRVVLGASLEKWMCIRIDNGIPDFGKTSHLGIILRESLSSPIKIKFLGHVTKMGTSLYIKPYAIWDIS